MEARSNNGHRNPTLYAVAHQSPEGGHSVAEQDIRSAIERAQEWLLARQQADGHWVGELQGDTILESEYVLLHWFLGKTDTPKLKKLCDYAIRHWLTADGGCPMYPGGPPDVSGSVKVYFACKLVGYSPDEPFMQRLRECILRLGGVTSCNTFTKLYLSIFGQYDWEGVPTIPPEIMLLPRWFYINIYAMSSWSRAILVPLAVINHFRPARPVPPECAIDELFVGGRHGKHLRLRRDRKLVTWRNLFLFVDRLLKVYDRSPIKPFRRVAIRAAEKWMRERQEGSGGLAAIFPAMTHAVMAYKCLGYPDDHPAVQHELRHLASFEIEDGDEIRVQPCLSPVWDTAIAVNALLDSGLPHDHPAIDKATEWLLRKQTRRVADWRVEAGDVAPGGWFFEYENEFYPDVDDTIMVLMALYKAYCPNGEHWTSAPPRIVEAMRRGLDWVFAMQNRDGGWASFDKDNDRMLLQYVPYADHNAMLDPSTADITARVLEMAAYYGIGADDPRIRRAIAFVLRLQEPDGSWFGRWGVNYIYGTWQVLRGLGHMGMPADSPEMSRGADWLEAHQAEDGGWGETPDTYEADVATHGRGPTTASQTAWALMGLLSAGRRDQRSVQNGLAYLLRTQRPDGAWDEEWFTGTGFPRVFYLRYHLYRHTFPLWALGQAAAARAHGSPREASAMRSQLG